MLSIMKNYVIRQTSYFRITRQTELKFKLQIIFSQMEIVSLLTEQRTYPVHLKTQVSMIVL